MPTRFHIAHIIPHPRLHGLNGYREVIDTVHWGLTALGHEVSFAVNTFSRGAVNIVFGFQMLTEEALHELPPETVVYNFEQMVGLPTSALKKHYAIAAGRLNVWEYSEFNLAAWQKLNPSRPVRHVPVAWAPILGKIPEARVQDIEVLIYGLPGELRLRVFYELGGRGLNCLFACGFYGPARDELIARSKIVLNVNLYDHSRIFEIVRVSYLLANKKAVIADKDPTTLVESDIFSAVDFAPPERIADECLNLLENDAERKALEKRGFETISRRDIRSILRTALL
jgi:hypothetical protein